MSQRVVENVEAVDPEVEGDNYNAPANPAESARKKGAIQRRSMRLGGHVSRQSNAGRARTGIGSTTVQCESDAAFGMVNFTVLDCPG